VKGSLIYQEILLEGKAEGLVEGEVKAANQIALNMMRSGLELSNSHFDF